MPEADTGCMGASTREETTSGVTLRGNGAPQSQHAVVGERGEVWLPDTDRHRWGIEPGKNLLLRETPEGLLLKSPNGVLRKVYVEPTVTCNLSCRTCVRHSWNEPIGSMEMDTYRRLIAMLRGVPSLDSMAFWGMGEPLMHPQILEMLSMAKELGIKTELVTNALLLDAEMAKGLVAVGLDTLVVSIDGVSPETYSEIRTGGALNLVRENVQHLLKARRATGHGKPELGIEFVAMRRNVKQLPLLARLAQQMEASFIVISNVLPYTEELKDEILYGLWAGRPYPSQRTPWAPEILLPRIDPKREIIELTGLLLSQTAYTSHPGRNDQRASGYCRFVEEGTIAVAWDGGISPCIPLMHSYSCYVMRRPKRIRRYTLGNAAQNDLLTLWNTPEYVAFRDRVHRFDFAPCTECGGCDLSETNEEDCFGNTFPVCGDCLWARGVIQCP